MADEKSFDAKRHNFYTDRVYAALKHQSTTENQNQIKIYKTLQELGQKTNEVRENTPCAKIPFTTLPLTALSLLL